MSRSPALGHLLALAVSVVWGTTYISTKVLLEAFHPVEILIFRFVLAWAILFLCAPRPQLPRSFRSELPFLGAALLLWLCHRTSRPGAAFFVGFVLAMAGIALISLAEGESLRLQPHRLSAGPGLRRQLGRLRPVSGSRPAARSQRSAGYPEGLFLGRPLYPPLLSGSAN